MTLNSRASIRRALLLFMFLAAVLGTGFLTHSCFPQAARIVWTETHQTIDGFGGSSADFLDSLTPAQADFFFTTSGLGLTILRAQIIPDRATCDTEFHQDACSETNGQSLNGELASAKLAVARGAIVFSTPWSPPAAYKSNRSFKNGGYLLPSFYGAWAKDIASYVTMMAANGVPIYAVSVQNEPDITTYYGSCTYSAQQLHDFIPYLYSALQSAGADATKIMVGEECKWRMDIASAAMTDPKVAPQIGILAAHAYGGVIRPLPAGNAHLWQTEGSSASPQYDGSIADGIDWAKTIHNYLTVANVNAWIWWFLTDIPRQGEGDDNAALTDLRGNIPKRAYVGGQWSRFVRPGWFRIGVRYSGSTLVSAFKDPQSQVFAIVAVNPHIYPVYQEFFLDGFSAGSVTPSQTSAKFSLQVRPQVPVNGTRFRQVLPPMSVTTFSGRNTSAP